MRMHPLVLAVATFFTATAFADDVLQQAETLLAQQQATTALELLAPLEDDRAGDPAYDYLLGVALLETHDASRAVFAFERCLAVEPKNGPCRVQMARTHLALGETPNARAELETINAYNPPPQVQALVAQYLGAVAAQEKNERQQLNIYAQFGMGFDTNINSATDQKQVAIPSFGNLLFSISPSGRKQDSTFINSELAGSYFYKATPQFTWLADGGIQDHRFLDNNDYSYRALNAGGGSAYQHGSHQVVGKLQLQTMWLGGKSYRDVTGLLGQYQYSLNMASQIASYIQLNRLRYDSQPQRDSNRNTLGVAYTQAFESRYSPVFYSSIYTGQDRTTDSAYDQFSQDFTGLRAGGQLSLQDNLKLNTSLSMENRQFKANFPLFNKARDEKGIDLNIGLAWQLSADILLTPNYTFSKNDSNISITSYDRHIIGVDIRINL